MSDSRTTSKCPTPDRLQAWLQGQVSEEEQDRIAAHVRRCPACETVLESLDGGDDSVVRDLRGGPQDAPLADADLERLLRRAEALGRSGSGEEEPESEQASLPTKLGRIVLLEPIGRGGMGVVYKALHRNLKMHVAVKVLPRDRRKDSRAAARFQREMEAAGRLVHENLVRALDAGEGKGRHYLVMEFIEGEDLQTYVRRNGPLPVAEACELVRQAALGLGHAHASGLVHRDVKPSNLMRTPQGTVKVLDLGLARIVDTDDVLEETASPRDTADETEAEKPLTRTAQVMGTGDYIAPEQVADSRTADARSDIYSLGCTLYFLLTRFPPFGGPEYSTFEKKVRAHVRSPIVPLQTLCPDAPIELSLVVQAMLAKKPSERPQSMREVADLMRIFAPRGESSTPAETERALREVRRRLDRRRIRTVGLAGILLLLTIAVAIVYGGAVGEFVPGLGGAAKKPVRPVVVDRPQGVPVPNLPRPPVRPVAKAPPVVLRPPPADRSDTPIDKAIASADPPPVDALGEDGLFDATRPRTVAEARVAQQQWAERLGEPVEKVNSVGMRFAVIPPGKFTMGSPPTEGYRQPDENQVPVTLTRPFRIGVHEVTQGQWQSVIGTTPWKDHPGSREGADFAAIYLTWEDAARFCRTLSERERAAGSLPLDEEYRLPTEAEWEWVCRAGTTTAYTCGSSTKLGDYAWYDRKATNPGVLAIGQKKPNAWGLYDIMGNVWEWCGDWYAPQLSGGTNPQGPTTGSTRAKRGGSWYGSPGYCRSASRDNRHPDHNASNVGFRVVKTIAVASSPDWVRSESPPASDVLEADGLFDATRSRTATETQAAQRQWAERLGQPVEVTNSVGMRLAVIPPGRFLMGSPSTDPHAADNERPQASVTISQPFRISVCETTQKQWETVMKSTPWMKGSLSRYYAKRGAEMPATYVSRGDLEDFCRRLTDLERRANRLPPDLEYALPTEAQWEYACRAGTTTAYSFGDDPAELGRHAWYGGLEGNGNAAKEQFAHAVGRKLPNAWGLFDMHGNAWEFCLEGSTPRPAGGSDPNLSIQGRAHVLRGGGWDLGPETLRSAKRWPGTSLLPNGRRGFRVIATIVRPAGE